MDEFERSFVTVLRSAAPAPPSEIDPAAITRIPRRDRARTIGAPVLAALAVAAIVITLLIVNGNGAARSREVGAPSASATLRPSAPALSRQPDDLVGSWILTDLQGLKGAAHTEPDAVLRFQFWPNGVISQGCDTAKAAVATGTLQFVQTWITTANTGCPHLDQHQALFLYRRVLTGTAHWLIRDGKLTVENGTSAAAFQRVGDALTAAQRDLALRIAKTEAQTSLPSGTSVPTTPAHTAPGWPPNVERVSAIVTTHGDAMRYVGAAGGDTTLVLVIRLVGDFSWITSGPPGHGSATGNVMTLVADAQTGTITDTGLEDQHPPVALPDATVIYPPTPSTSPDPTSTPTKPDPTALRAPHCPRHAPTIEPTTTLPTAGRTPLFDRSVAAMTACSYSESAAKDAPPAAVALSPRLAADLAQHLNSASTTHNDPLLCLQTLTFSVLVARDAHGVQLPPITMAPGCEQAAATNGITTRYINLDDPILRQAIRAAGKHQPSH